MNGSKHVFIAGATGYLGSRLATALLGRGHRVRALVRSGSEARLPAGVEPIPGNALDAASFATRVAGCDTFVQMIGVAHPSPAKAAQFQSIDLVAGLAGLQAAWQGGVAHFVYLSVAQGAPVMRAYQASRAEVEAAIAASGIAATLLRPWYVLGPGHRWPMLFAPLFAVARWLPWTRLAMSRMEPVRLEAMIQALVEAIEHPSEGRRVVEIADIQRLATR